MVHEGTDGDGHRGGALFPDEPGVIAAQEARGWVVQDETPAELDPDAPNADPPVDVPAGELKGKALDEALKARGLPITGTADEKRSLLADNTPASANDEGDIDD